MKKVLLIFSIILFSSQISHCADDVLAGEIADSYRSFLTRRYEHPSVEGIYLAPAVRYVHHLQLELRETIDGNVAKKLREKIAAIIMYGAGVGGVSTEEANDVEKKVLLSAFYEVSKNATAARDAVVDTIFLSQSIDDFTPHQRVLYLTYQATQEATFFVPNFNFLQDQLSYEKLCRYIDSKSVPFIDLTGNSDDRSEPQPSRQIGSRSLQAFGAPGRAYFRTTGLDEIVSEILDDEQVTNELPPSPKKWEEITAPILSELYKKEYGEGLLNGHRIVRKQSFPLKLITKPSGWAQLIQRCAIGRDTQNLSKDIIRDLEDVFLNIADQLGWISGGGKDSSDAGRQMRHIVNEMGLGIDKGKELLNSLGYGVKKVRQRRGFRSGNEILDF